MQVMSSPLSLSPSFNKFSGTGFPDIAGSFSRDFEVKLQLTTDEPSMEQEEKPNNQLEVEEEEVNEGEEEEFSFVCLNPDSFSISAEDVFQNGQIRPIFPLFNQDILFADENGSGLKSEDGDVSLRPPLKKIFVEDSPETTMLSSSEPAGPYCEWKSGYKTVVEEISPNTCKKSNSTGFSKLWRFRDLMVRSNSNGKDAFVFLNQPPSSSTSSVKTEKKSEKEEKNPKVKVDGEIKMVKKVKSGKTKSSAHEKLYVQNRAMREGDKRRSYLPYKQVGFFTNVNGLSRNVHPF